MQNLRVVIGLALLAIAAFLHYQAVMMRDHLLSPFGDHQTVLPKGQANRYIGKPASEKLELPRAISMHDSIVAIEQCAGVVGVLAVLLLLSNLKRRQPPPEPCPVSADAPHPAPTDAEHAKEDKSCAFAVSC